MKRKVIHFSLESLPIFTMQINIIIHSTDKICKIYTYGPLGQSFDLLRKTNKLINLRTENTTIWQIL